MGQRLHRKEILRIIKSDICGNQHQGDELLLGSQLENKYWREDILGEDFPIIGKIFPQNVFSGEKPFQCEVCGTAYAQKGNLKNHQVIHFGKSAPR